MLKTITIGEGLEAQTYLLETMTAGDGLDIQEQVDEAKNDLTTRQKSIKRTLYTVASSLRGGDFDNPSLSLEGRAALVRKIPWSTYLEIIDHALEVNGMKATPGEVQAPDGANPAA